MHYVDKHGTPIVEGDILWHAYGPKEVQQKYTIYTEKEGKAWLMTDMNQGVSGSKRKIREYKAESVFIDRMYAPLIVGNKFENPEMLKQPDVLFGKGGEQVFKFEKMSDDAWNKYKEKKEIDLDIKTGAQYEKENPYPWYRRPFISWRIKK